MWRHGYHWFRATNKTNYCVMAPQVTLHTTMMKDPFKIVWTAMRTASIKLHVGKNVGWDFILERFNRDCKMGMEGHVTEERIYKWVKLLNAFKHIKQLILNFLGLSDQEDHYNIYKDSMIEAIANIFSVKVGSTMQEVLGLDTDGNPLKHLSCEVMDPMGKVYEFAHGVTNGTTWEQHSRHHMNTPELPPLDE